MKHRLVLLLTFFTVAVSAATGEMPVAELQIVDSTPSGSSALNLAVLRYGITGKSIATTRCDYANAMRGLDAGKFHIALINKAAIPADFKGRIIPAFYEVLVGYTNLANRVTAVETKKIVEVWRGVRPIWRTLGGNASDIHRYMIASGEPGGEMVESFLKLRTQGTGIAEFRNTSEVVLYVSRDPAALALARYQEDIPGESVRMLAIDGVFPSRQNIESGKYPWSRRYVWAISDAGRDRAEAFLPYLSDDEFYRALLAEDLLPAK